MLSRFHRWLVVCLWSKVLTKTVQNANKINEEGYAFGGYSQQAFSLQIRKQKLFFNAAKGLLIKQGKQKSFKNP